MVRKRETLCAYSPGRVRTGSYLHRRRDDERRGWRERAWAEPPLEAGQKIHSVEVVRLAGYGEHGPAITIRTHYDGSEVLLYWWPGCKEPKVLCAP